MSFLAPKQQYVPSPAIGDLPQPPGAPPMFGSQAKKPKSSGASTESTFLGAQPQNTAQKTLLGA